mgnify:CR=1 FL=1
MKSIEIMKRCGKFSWFYQLLRGNAVKSCRDPFILYFFIKIIKLSRKNGKNYLFFRKFGQNVHYIRNIFLETDIFVHYIRSDLWSKKSVSPKMFIISECSLYPKPLISEIYCIRQILGVPNESWKTKLWALIFRQCKWDIFMKQNFPT